MNPYSYRLKVHHSGVWIYNCLNDYTRKSNDAILQKFGHDDIDKEAESQRIYVNFDYFDGNSDPNSHTVEESPENKRCRRINFSQ